MAGVAALISMLHQPAAADSATRLFRNRPVLDWTLQRLRRARRVEQLAVVCWEDQAQAILPLAERHAAHMLVKSPRVRLASLESVTAARRWADGWRGGLLGSCDFDLGFHGPWAAEVATELKVDGLLLVDPAAALVDPVLLDNLIEHAGKFREADLVFSQAAPGLSGVLLRGPLLAQLAEKRLYPGRLLAYVPDHPLRDAIGTDACAPIPMPVARSVLNFKLDSDRQVRRIERATESLNGQLISTEAQTLVERLGACCADDRPRELTLELTTRRNTQPIYLPHVERPACGLDAIQPMLRQFAADDARLILGGLGDPLLDERVFEVIDVATELGIAVALETDLLGVDETTIARLADSAVDVISVFVPATTPGTYRQIMGTDGLERVVENIRLLVEGRVRRQRGVPLVVPTFVKCRQNLGEMEAWYDQWLRVLGCAVIRGPSDFGGLIEDCSVGRMDPPRRGPCVRLAHRLTVLCDGRVTRCEEDAAGHGVLGTTDEPLAELWKCRGETDCCARCHEWHRP